MMNIFDIAIMILMASSMIVLLLETIGEQSSKDLEKPHVWLFTCATIMVCLSMFILSLSNVEITTKKPAFYIKEISSIFLCINSLISIFMIKRTLKNQSGEFYFLIIASLALAMAHVYVSSLPLKMTTIIAWLVLSTTLAIRGTDGGKKAEVGLKLSLLTTVVVVAFIFAYFCLVYAQTSLHLDQIVIKSSPGSMSVALFGLLFLIVVGLALTGAPPLNFGHIDCADGANIGVAYLFLSNSFIQGGLLLSQIKMALLRSGINSINDINIEASMLIIGFMILWLRALDQSKIRRTTAYIATSVGPLFAMSMLFGLSLLLPKLIYLIAIYCFGTLALFTLFASLADMGQYGSHVQTWEDLSGFGRTNPLQTLTLLTAVATISGLPGTLGYFIKLSLIAPLNDSIIFSGSIFLSISIGAACTMRIFVFAFSKHSSTKENILKTKSQMTVIAASIILMILGFFPFVR